MTHPKEYRSEVNNRIEHLHRKGKVLWWEETVTDNGIPKVYGYTTDGCMFLLNVSYVRKMKGAKE